MTSQLEPRPSAANLEAIHVTLATLHAMAKRALGKNGGKYTLQPSDVAHEVWIRINQYDPSIWERSSDYRALARTLTRHLLIDHRRRRGLVKRTPLDEVLGAAVTSYEKQQIDILAIHEMLEILARHERPRLREAGALLELMHFELLSAQAAAERLGLSETAAKKRIALASGWLAARYPELDD